MPYNSDIHHRRSVRLRGYDYSQAGLYFVTICVKDRVAAFGTVMDGNMYLSEKGEIAQHVWNGLPERFPYLEIDDFVIMPDHVHGILVIPFDVDMGETVMPTLGQIVRAYKAVVTRSIRVSGMPEFEWHRSYNEHVIRLRNKNELERVRQYIISNPARWQQKRGNQ